MNIAAHVANMAADHAEQFRDAGLRWAKSDERARKLKELKDHELAKRMKAQGDKPIAAAKRDVEASQGWADFLTEMVQARTQANRERIEMEYLHMKFFERHGVRRALDLLSGDAT
jgi:hypothetical protein